MAKLYYQKLEQLLSTSPVLASQETAFELRHFFSGAAIYVNKTLCISWSPGGLAFKLPESEVENLIENGAAVSLKYFKRGHVKKGYAAFMAPEDYPAEHWEAYIKRAIAFAQQ